VIPNDDHQIGEDDPTAEEEALEFDGTHTMQLDDVYRVAVLAAHEKSAGPVPYEDRGDARWKWAADTVTPCDLTGETVDYLKALDGPLTIEDTQPMESIEQPRLAGYNAYDTPPRKKGE
jgi:hypothetical protein